MFLDTVIHKALRHVQKVSSGIISGLGDSDLRCSPPRSAHPRCHPLSAAFT